MTWLEKTIRSFSIGGASAFRFMGDGTKNPEANHFHKIVRDLKSNMPPTSCIDYFMEHFGHYSTEEIKSLKLDHEISFIIVTLIPYLIQKLADTKEPPDLEFHFLTKAVPAYIPETKSNLLISDFVFKILETDNNHLLEISKIFIAYVMSISTFQAYFFKGEASIKLWNECFIKNPNSNHICGPVFSNSMRNFSLKNGESVKSLLESMLESMRLMKLCEATAQNSIDFIAIVITKFNTGNFLSSFFNSALPFFNLLENFDCFSLFLVAPTTVPSIPWDYLNQLCRNPNLKKELLVSTIHVVHSLKNSPLIGYFITQPFALRAKELDNYTQVKLFEILKQLPINEKHNFFANSIPTWETGVNTALLEVFVKENSWDSLISAMISEFILINDQVLLRKQLNEDKSLYEILSFLFSKVQPDFDLSVALFHPFVVLAQENNEEKGLIPIAIKGIKLLTECDQVTLFTFPFIGDLQDNLITDTIFDLFSILAIKSPDFVATFLQNNGIEALFHCLKSTASIDFMAALACNGPYEAIDDYVSKNFEQSELTKLSEDKLVKLMMGLKQDSESLGGGLLRIPSLCKFIKDIPILTQFDRYIFGSYAVKYVNPTNGQLCQYAPTYIEQDAVFTLCNNAKHLSHLTNQTYQHFPVFQCHIDAPHCAASIKLGSNTTFWIYVEKLFAKTIIMSTHFGEIILEENSIHFFGLPPVTCLPQRWYMVTIIISDRTFTQQNVSCYFNLTHVGIANTKPGLRATLGSETHTNAIYYFSGSFQISNQQTNLTMPDLKQRFENGPSTFFPTPIRMKPGFLFIPYKGIAKYLPRLGGQEFIFLKLLESNSSEEFNLFAKSAFNLLHLSLIKPSFFFVALRYSIVRMKQFINPTFDSLIRDELNSQPEKRWSYASQILCDYNVLTTEESTLSFLPDIIETCDSTQFVDFLFDSFIIFDLSPQKESIFVQCLKTLINSTPELLKKVLLLITASNFIEVPGFVDSLYDEKMRAKQEILFQILLDNMHLFPKEIPFDNALECLSTIPEDLAIDLFHNISKMTLIYPNYFSIDAFNKYLPLFTLYVKNETVFWNALLIFYTGGSADQIEDFSELDVIRPEMTENILDLICERMTYEWKKIETVAGENSSNDESNNKGPENTIVCEIADGKIVCNKQKADEEINENKNDEFLSVRVLKTVIKLITNSDLQILDYFNQIQRLCALGFDQFPNSPMPLSMEEDLLKPKLLSIIQNNLFSREKIEKFRSIRIHPLDPSMYEETSNYLRQIEIPDIDYDSNSSTLSCNIENSSMNVEVNSLKIQPSKLTIQKFLDSENADIVSKLAACALVQKLNTLTIARKIGVKILINGTDVLPEISVPMHKKIALAMLTCNIPMDDESFEFFLKFEITRTIEGWWDGDVVTLFKSSFPRACELYLTNNKAAKHYKLMKQLFITCFSKCSLDDESMKMIIYLSNSPIFKDFINDPFFINLIGHSLAKPEILQSNDFQCIKIIILECIQNNSSSKASSFRDALNNDSLIEWCKTQTDINSDSMIDSEIYTSYLAEIKKIALSSSKSDRETRVDITRQSNLISIGYFQATRLLDSFYIRSAFKFQFINRFNSSNMEIDVIISKLFMKKVKLNLLENHPQKFMVAAAPQPFVVPQKLIPLTYSYPVPEKKLSNHLQIPVSHHKKEYPTRMTSLNIEFFGPKCLEGWDLPPFISSISDNKIQQNKSFTDISSMFLVKQEKNDENRDTLLTPLLKSFFMSRFLINCSMLSTPEILPCIATYNNEYFYILMNAVLVDNNVCLKQSSDMLCHFAALENAMNGIYGHCRLFANHPTLRFKFSDILIAIPRRFVYSNTEIDLFLVNGLHFTFVLKESERKVFMSKVKPLPFIHCNSGPIFAANLLCNGLSNVTKMWLDQSISSYDYLMYLNISSGRSFNDLSQYPIFPWVLGAFEENSPILKRDLSKPMGAQTKARMERFLANFAEAYPHCHYGTHYSHPAGVLHYMMRIEPFTLYNLYLHNGLDHVDRQFSSVSESWKSASENNQSDLKELIPEFYTFPEMFENVNQVDFKSRTDGTSLSTVLMPSWGKDPMVFIWKMRDALESPETTSKLSKWIDLIFGYKQRGQAAIEAVNVFQPLTYELTSDETQLNDPVLLKGMIDAVNQFGQCPQQIFLSPHPNAQRTELPNILNTKFLINSLSRVEAETYSIQFEQNNPIFLQRFEHRVGPRYSLVKIWDNYIEQELSSNLLLNTNSSLSINSNSNFGTTTNIIESVDAICASCISNDYLYLVVASRLGVINLFSCFTGSPVLMTQIIANSFEIKTLAISTQHGIICAASDKTIMLFDYSTSLFLRELSVDYEITAIIFDDISNFIICLSKKGFYIYGIDLRFIVKTPNLFKRNFTCISACDSPVWSPKPFYVTGHIGGYVYAWELSLNKAENDQFAFNLKPTMIMQIGRTIVNAVSIFANNKAIIAVDRTGCVSLASVVPMNSSFISSSCFNKCSVCQTDIVKRTSHRCATCGLYVCKSCLVARRPPICSNCQQLFSPPIEEITPYDIKSEEEESKSDTKETVSTIKLQHALTTQNLLETNEEEESDSFGTGIDLVYRDPSLLSNHKFKIDNITRNFRHSI